MIEEKDDFFEATPEEKPKKIKVPKPPKYKPDDPRYYDREDGRWDHLKPSPYRRMPMLWMGVGIAALLFLLIGFYSYFFSPVVEEATEYGYVENVQREGTVFKTYEGVILPYRTLMDSLREYDGDFVFSTKDDHVAAELKRYQDTGTPVKVNYKIYRTRIPWRGASKIIVTGVDSVDAATLLPPDRRPEHAGS